MLYGLLGTGPWQLHLCGFIFMTPKHLDGEGKRWASLPDVLSTWQQVSRRFLCKVTVMMNPRLGRGAGVGSVRKQPGPEAKARAEGVLQLLSTHCLQGPALGILTVTTCSCIFRRGKTRRGWRGWRCAPKVTEQERDDSHHGHLLSSPDPAFTSETGGNKQQDLTGPQFLHM